MDNEKRYSLGYFLKKSRKSKGKTQREVAELLNITPNYYGEIERGKKEPSLDLYRSICEKLSLHSDMMTNKDELDIAFSELRANCPENKKGYLASLFKIIDNLVE